MYLFSIILLAGLVISTVLFFLIIYQILWNATRIPETKKKLKADVPRRIYIVIRNVFLQGKLFKDLGGGIMHSLFFWGFIAFGFYSTDFILAGINPSYQLLGPGLFSNIVFFTVDLFALIVLADVFHSVIRRWVLKVKRYRGYNGFEAALILIFIAVLMVTYFMLGILRLDGATSSIKGSIMEFLAPTTTPITYALASVLPKASGTFAYYTYWVTWAIHSSIFLAFLIYVPRSKHLHLFAAPFNVFFSDGKQAQLTKIDFENATRFGATDIRDFSWKDYFDFYSCTECGRCTDNCPANMTGKTLSPRDIIWDLREVVMEQSRKIRAGEDRDTVMTTVLEDPIKEKDLWSCTTCMACVEQCPTMIDHVPKIVNMRRSLVLNQGKAPRELIDLYRNLEQYKSPYSIDPSTRGDWAKDMDVLDLSEKEGEYDVLFWVGCVQSFDRRNQDIARAVVTILEKAGVKFAIMGKDESCTGDPARRTGNEYLADQMIKENVEKFKARNIKNVITACPHCFNSLKNDYREFGIELNVYHHSQYINQLIQKKKIAVKPLDSDVDEKYTYHDPCYLGRYNREFDAPREVINNFAMKYEELKMNKTKALCCGAGGGRLWMEEKEGTMVSHKRIEMVSDVKASQLVTSCPYCMTMLDDARKTTGKEESIKMKDLAELVAERLN